MIDKVRIYLLKKQSCNMVPFLGACLPDPPLRKEIDSLEVIFVNNLNPHFDMLSHQFYY